MAVRLIESGGAEAIFDSDPGNVRMRQFARGDAAAFEALYREHKRGVFNFCRRMLGAQADAGEAMQEIFFKVIAAAPSWKPRAKFTTWLYTIARNHCHDLLRRVRPQAAAEGETEGPAAPLSDPPLREQLILAIEALPPEQREVFVMAAALEMSFSEIAEVVGAPLNTTKSRMRLAVKRLREQLTGAGIAIEEKSDE